MKIAWFTPFSFKSAIGKCSAQIIKELLPRVDVTVFASDITDRRSGWLPAAEHQFLANTALSQTIEMLRDYDIAIYNLGDNYLLHGDIYKVSLHHPGIVVLHDTIMTHFFSGYYFLDQKSPQGFVEAMRLSHGPEGEAFAEAYLEGRLPRNIMHDPIVLRFNMARAATQGAYGVVVHSDFARQTLEANADAPVRKIDFPTPHLDHLTAPGLDPAPDPDGRVRLLTFGVVNPNKMVGEIIAAIAQSPTLRERVVYDVIGSGEAPIIAHLRSQIETHNLGEIVHLHGFQPDDVLHDYLRRADVIINLRNPHFGESSWSLLEALFAAKPTVVWAHGYYDEFPADVVAKVAHHNDITPTLEALVSDPARRRTLGQRAQAYAAENFRSEAYAVELLRFAQETLYNKPVLDLADHVAREMHQLGDFPGLDAVVTEQLDALFTTTRDFEPPVARDTAPQAAATDTTGAAPAVAPARRRPSVPAPRPIRIMVWAPHINLGGGTRLLAQLAPALARHPEVEFVRLAAPPYFPDQDAFAPDEQTPIQHYQLRFTRWINWLAQDRRVLGVPFSRNLKTHVRTRTMARRVEELRQAQMAAAAADCDVVYVFWPHRQEWIPVDKPVVCTYQDATYFEYPELLGGPVTQQEWHTSNRWLHNVAQIVVSSKATRDVLVRHFGDFCRSAEVVHHAISPQRTAPNPKAVTEQNLGFTLPAKYFLYAANTTAHKNHFMLLNAYAHFVRRDMVPVILTGENTDLWDMTKTVAWWQTSLVGLVNRTGLKRGQDFYGLGYVSNEDARTLLEHATAVVVPTLAEGGGSYPVEEALCAGIPVACSDIPVLREHVAYHSAKVAWFDPMSVTSMIDAFNDILDNYDDYKASAVAGMNDPRPTWDDIAAQYVDIFKSVAKI